MLILRWSVVAPTGAHTGQVPSRSLHEEAWKSWKHSPAQLLRWEVKMLRTLRKMSLFLLLGIACNAKLVEKSFETGKQGIHPGFTQVWGDDEPTITQTGQRQCEGTCGSRNEVLRNKNSSSSPVESCLGTFLNP